MLEGLGGETSEDLLDLMPREGMDTVCRNSAVAVKKMKFGAS